MKRNALSAVNPNLSRAEQLAQWKEAKAQSLDVKKRPRAVEPGSEDLKKKIKDLQTSILEKDSTVAELQDQIRTRSATIESLTEKIRKLEECQLKLKADSKTQNATIQQLRDVVRKSVAEYENCQELIKDLQQKCDEIPAMQSHIVELSLLNQCLQQPLKTEPDSVPLASTVVIADTKFRDVYKSEKMALQAEIRTLKSNNDYLQLRCEELQFNAKLLLQQNAELLENAMKYVAKKDKDVRLERDAERNELAQAMNSMKSELTQRLDEREKEIAELQQEIARFRQTPC